jgi:DnaJ like chaperone protein
MSWWGKVIGGAFGFMLGGPLGALFGAALGHNFDVGLRRRTAEQIGADFDERERTQTAFFAATFAVMGHVAKADGRVTRDEIQAATMVMNQMGLSPELRRVAQSLFNQGKQSHFDLDEALDQFRRECHRRRNLLRVFIEIQLQAAYADGVLHPEERHLLLNVCERLGFPRFEFNALEAMIRAERHFRTGRRATTERPGLTVKAAYALLNVQPDAGEAEVKRAYRRLMSQHHPDKLVSKGLPEEMVKVATQKTQEIKAAYEKIREARGL